MNRGLATANNFYGSNRDDFSNAGFGYGSQVVNAGPPPEPFEKRKFMVRGRQICLGECNFIFKRIWKATLDGCNH